MVVSMLTRPPRLIVHGSALDRAGCTIRQWGTKETKDDKYLETHSVAPMIAEVDYAPFIFLQHTGDMSHLNPALDLQIPRH